MSVFRFLLSSSLLVLSLFCTSGASAAEVLVGVGAAYSRLGLLATDSAPISYNALGYQTELRFRGSKWRFLDSAMLEAFGGFRHLFGQGTSGNGQESLTNYVISGGMDLRTERFFIGWQMATHLVSGKTDAATSSYSTLILSPRMGFEWELRREAAYLRVYGSYGFGTGPVAGDKSAKTSANDLNLGFMLLLHAFGSSR